jgi:hypothetical protein
MTDPGYIELIHAEIDGELDAQQRAELARRLLANPEARAQRDDLQRLCKSLEALEAAEPPPQLLESVLAALPHSAPGSARSWWADPRWRYAAMFAGVLVAAAVVFETVDRTRNPGSEAAGTMATHLRGPVDSVRLGNGPVLGQVSLYRDGAGLSLGLELVASAPVDVLIASGGHTLRVNGLGRPEGSGMRPTAVPLPGFGTSGQTVSVTFLMAGRQVGVATLGVPESP